MAVHAFGYTWLWLYIHMAVYAYGCICFWLYMATAVYSYGCICIWLYMHKVVHTNGNNNNVHTYGCICIWLYMHVAVWNRKDKIYCCKACVNIKEKQGTPYRWNTCGLWKASDAFAECYRHLHSLTTRVCEDCIERRPCCMCGKQKTATEFTKGEWTQTSKQDNSRGKCKACALRNRVVKQCTGECAQSLTSDSFTKRMWMMGDDSRKCMKCMERPKRGTWPCIECKSVKCIDDYSLWLAPRATKKNNGTARWNSCKQKQLDVQQESIRDSVVHVTKKMKKMWAIPLHLAHFPARIPLTLLTFHPVTFHIYVSPFTFHISPCTFHRDMKMLDEVNVPCMHLLECTSRMPFTLLTFHLSAFTFHRY